MKNKLIHLVVVGFLMVIAICAADAQSSGPFTLNWNALEYGGACSGGVTTAGGAKYALTGTVGQPDAGASAAGTYVQEGGFVPGFIETVGPPLAMARAGNQLNFTWPHLGTGFRVEGASTLDGPWTFLSDGTLVGPNWQATVPSPSSPAFFRLKKDCPK